MNERMHDLLNERMNWSSSYVSAKKREWINERKNKFMNEWIIEWINEWMNEWINNE